MGRRVKSANVAKVLTQEFTIGRKADMPKAPRAEPGCAQLLSDRMAAFTYPLLDDGHGFPELVEPVETSL
jgi:hypothetical protein